MRNITAYLTHPIRGKDGNNATQETMESNNNKAITMGKHLTTLMPNLTLYIPAEMDKFLIPRGVAPITIVDALLNLDCAIIKGRDILLVYNHDGWMSGGMKIEMDYAHKHNKPIIIFNDKVRFSDLIDVINRYKDLGNLVTDFTIN